MRRALQIDAAVGAPRFDHARFFQGMSPSPLGKIALDWRRPRPGGALSF